MASHHALSGELIDIRPLGEALKATRTTTLYKTQHLEVFRMILLAGKQMPAHRVVGEFTVQCLEGSVEFSIGTTRDVMRAGDLKCLAGGRAPFVGCYRGLVCAHHAAAPWRLR